MKRLILSVLAVLAIAAVVAGCGSSNTSSLGNTELQGTWKETVPDVNGTITFTFNGNNWVMIQTWESQGSLQRSGTFTFNSAANPKTIDVYVTDSPVDSQMVGTTSLGIYQLSGNDLKLDLGDPGEARPTAFTEEDSFDLVKQ